MRCLFRMQASAYTGEALDDDVVAAAIQRGRLTPPDCPMPRRTPAAQNPKGRRIPAAPIGP